MLAIIIFCCCYLSALLFPASFFVIVVSSERDISELTQQDGRGKKTANLVLQA